MDQYTRFRLPIMVLLYVILRFFGGSFGNLVLYPVVLMVTFLHEFGHALGALLTGGNVLELVINTDGSGYTKSQGGSAAIILMGGYLGSAILGNIMLYIGTESTHCTCLYDGALQRHLVPKHPNHPDPLCFFRIAVLYSVQNHV